MRVQCSAARWRCFATFGRILGSLCLSLYECLIPPPDFFVSKLALEVSPLSFIVAYVQLFTDMRGGWSGLGPKSVKMFYDFYD